MQRQSGRTDRNGHIVIFSERPSERGRTTLEALDGRRNGTEGVEDNLLRQKGGGVRNSHWPLLTAGPLVDSLSLKPA